MMWMMLGLLLWNHWDDAGSNAVSRKMLKPAVDLKVE